MRATIQLSGLPRAPPGVVGKALNIGEWPNIFLSAYPVNWELQRAAVAFASGGKDLEGRIRHALEIDFSRRIGHSALVFNPSILAKL